MNNRRKLVIALGISALAAPLACFAQQPSKVWRVGFLLPLNRRDSPVSEGFGPFLRGMSDLGYVEGKNLVIEWRSAEGKSERLPRLAAELVQLKVDVIVTPSPQATSAAQKSTTSIPIVMANSDDPVGSGFAKSLARPGGNITGLSNITGDISPKHLEMLLSVVPKMSRVAVLVNPTNASLSTVLKSVQSAAQTTSAKILPVEARTAQEIDEAFSAMTREKVGAVIVARDALFILQARQIAELAAKNHLPSIAQIREYVDAGGLMSYGQNRADNYRRVATYVDKILKGAKPGDLPIEQPTKFELIINGKTAKTLRLTIPQSLLISADQVIE